MTNKIVGIEVKSLSTHNDDRGYFREIIRYNDDFFKEVTFQQLSHSFVVKDVIKAWHYHKEQTDFWYLASGEIKVGLADMREKSPTYLKSDEIIINADKNPICLKIPPGIAHGYKCLSDNANVIYLMNKTYDPTDEYRLDHDDPQIGFSW